MLRELQNIILLQDWRKPTSRAEWSVGILGGAIALIGIILALGGAKLIGAGGSWYYLFAGLALIVAGLAVAQRKLLGAWIYVGAFLGPRSGLFGKSASTAGRWCRVSAGRSLSCCSSFCPCLYWTRTAGVGEGCSDSAALRSL